MEQKRLGSAGSTGSAGGGFRTGTTPPRQLSKDNCVATLAEPVRKLQTTPDLVIENSVEHPIKNSVEHPITPSRAAQDQVVAPDSSERPHVRFPENVEPQRRDISNFPLLVDARCTRGNPEEVPTSNTETSDLECATLRGMNLEGAWPESGSGGGWESPAHPPWPESTSGGGATCSPPHLVRKRLPPAVHEPMGEVLLLGSGLRAPPSARCESSKPVPVKPRVEVVTKRTEPKEEIEHGKSAHVLMTKNGISTPSPGDVSELAIIQPKKIEDPADSLGKTGSQATVKRGRRGDRDDDANQGQPSANSSPKAIDVKSTAVPCVSSPKAESMPEVKGTVSRETDILDEMQERLESTLRPVVEKHEIGLQTDASPRGGSGPHLTGLSAESRRILLLQRCDPRHVNLSSWIPLPRPKIPMPTEKHYLSHVRSHFPGTIDKNCRLETPPIFKRSRPLATPRRTDS